MHIVTVKNEYGSYAEKINMSYFCLNLGQTAEDSDIFTIIWLRPRGLKLKFQNFSTSVSSVMQFLMY